MIVAIHKPIAVLVVGRCN